MARATEQLKQAMEVCELGALTLPNQVDVLMDAARAILQEVSTLTPPNEPERAGLYGKYTVYKNKDGSLVTDCFILRPAKDSAAVAALRAYAAATDNAELAADIINWVGAEPNEWVSVEDALPPEHEPVLCIVSGKPNPNITLEDAYQIGSWNKADGWIIDEYLDWEDADVSWWMSLPAPPDKGNNVLAKTPNEPLTLEHLRASPHGKIKDSTLQSICNRANEIGCRPPVGEADA